MQKDEIRVVKHLWGLTWPTLIVTGIIFLAIVLAVYRLYVLALLIAQQ